MKRICNLITGYLFALFLLGFAIAFVLIPDNEVSAEENRRLAVFPEFTWERLADGSFSSDINDYFADQFPFRDMFVGIKGTIETGMLRGENNGVLVGTDGQTAVRRFNVYKSRIEHTKDMDYYYPETLALNVEGLNRFAAEVDIGGSVERVHVKNTGRCAQLLLPGNKVYLERRTSSSRRTEAITGSSSLTSPARAA